MYVISGLKILANGRSIDVDLRGSTEQRLNMYAISCLKNNNNKTGKMLRSIYVNLPESTEKPIKVLYENHMCAILFILQRTSITNIIILFK